MADPKTPSPSGFASAEKMTNSFSSSTLNNTLPTITVKLGERNYAYWKSQVFPVLKAYELESFVTSEKPCPSAPILSSTDESKRLIDSEHVMWKKIDQFLFSWLISSISETVEASKKRTETMFRHAANCETAYDTWHTLEMHFLIDSKARVLHLRNQLQTNRKDNSSIFEYVLKMKEIASGVTVSDEELLLYILDGLGSEYDAMVAALTIRSSEVSLQEA
ncbi:uncharacterized protein LOC116121741 [Pistacia vera]|uniref:uncharacterized protein LOC116121741 n=1 Tax=Pistacia vera TaxID=55513 RepID=UPI0012637686|nr:uncharacterized protein LOC116121741 [Pistacia vera]